MSVDEKDISKPSYAAPALTKGLEVLELLATSSHPMTMKEIADGLGRSKSEIFRMLVALQERNYIDRDPDTDAFSLTDRLFKLGLHMPMNQDLMAAAMPILTEVSQISKQSPHVVVINHGRTVVISTFPGGADMCLTLRLGYGRLATDATSGRVLIAFQTPQNAARIIGDCEALSRTPIDRDALGKELARIRARGYELRESDVIVGVTDICCPILGADGNGIASVIIPYLNLHAGERNHRFVLETLKAGCDRITARLSPRLRPDLEQY